MLGHWRSRDGARRVVEGQADGKVRTDFPTGHGTPAYAGCVGRHRYALRQRHVLRGVGQPAGWLRVDGDRHGRRRFATGVAGRDGVVVR